MLLSSHLLAELERVADYLILLSRGRVQVAVEVEDLLAGHRVLTGPAAEAGRYARWPGVHVRRGQAQAHLLVRACPGDPVPAGWEAHPVGLQELALACLREPGAAALPGPARGRALPLQAGEPWRPSSGSRAAGCSRCRCCSSPRPSGWSAAAPPEPPGSRGLTCQQPSS